MQLKPNYFGAQNWFKRDREHRYLFVAPLLEPGRHRTFSCRSSSSSFLPIWSLHC